MSAAKKKPEEDQSRAEARKLLASPRFFNKFLAAVERAGLIGERKNALVLLIVVVSRLLRRPLSALVKGMSAAGKNWLVTRIFLLMPRGRVRELSSLSERAWNYLKDYFRHRVIYLQERGGEAGGTVHPMRLLISEQKIVRLVTQWIDGKRVTKKFVARGPVAAISTTTKSGLEIDDETRHVSLFVDESPEQTRRIVQAYARQERVLPEAEVLIWQMVHRLIEERADLEIVFPEWFDEVAASTFVNDVIVRRYFPAFVEACRTVCLIRSFRRELPEGGKITLAFSDFAIAALIFDGIFVESLHRKEGSALETRRAVQKACEKKDGEPVQAEDLATELGISLDRAYARLREAERAGVIRRANPPEKDNRKLYRAAPRPRFIPDPEKLFGEVTGAGEKVRFVHPITGEWVTYFRTNVKKKVS
jgi:hypothetical protein